MLRTGVDGVDNEKDVSMVGDENNVDSMDSVGCENRRRG